MRRNKSGISLIVLAITVIVMIILAATVIISLTDTGVIGKANTAVDETNLKEIQQLAELAWVEATIDKMKDDSVDLEQRVKDALAKKNISEESYTLKITEDGLKVIPAGSDPYTVAGLYDENDELIATWDELINDYGVDFSERGHHTVNSSTMLSNIIANNSELQTAVTLKTSDEYTIIEREALCGCTTLKRVILANTVTAIRSTAFENCTSLITVIIPNSVTTIESDAFNGCTSLTTINIPDSVTDLNYNAFYGCTSLKYKEYNNAYYLGSENNPYKFLMKCSNTEITNCEINPSNEYISAFVFCDCSSLVSVTIPTSVIAIDNMIFCNCTLLESVNYSGTVEQWEKIDFRSSSGGKWYTSSNITEVVCSNGTITIE